MTHPDPVQPPRGWHALPRPRLAAPPAAQQGVLFRSLSLLARRFGRHEVPAVFAVLNIHRRLFRAWLWFASRLMPNGRLPGTARELLILRTAWNCRCRYEWGQHLELGLRYGLGDEDVLAAGRDSQTCADPGKRLLLQACDELCTDDMLRDDTWASLQSFWGSDEIIEITMLVGHYRMLAGFLNSAGLALEAPVEHCVQAFWRRVAAREYPPAASPLP